MIGRIITLIWYLLRSLIFSLGGLLYILLALAFYTIFFDPRQNTPDIDYYGLLFGLFGISLSFLVTLSVAARANKAIHLPLVVRLESRIEYLTAVMLAALLYSLMVQYFFATIAYLANGPDLSFLDVLIIPILWVSADILLVTIALHATDLVTKAWSRVYVFAIIGLLLYLNSEFDLISGWLASGLNSLGRSLASGGTVQMADLFFEASSWFSQDSTTIIDRFVDLVFWPFSAITQGLVNGSFTMLQALAPAIILFYASMMFILASAFFASKDLFFTE
jgi:hypothetical protein